MEKFYAVTDYDNGQILSNYQPYGINIYAHPLLAAFLAPISYDKFEKFRLWELKNYSGEPDCFGLYHVATWVYGATEIRMPIVTPQQRMEFAIHCWKESPDPRQPEMEKWMDRWLAGDREVTWTVDGINATITSAAMRKRIDFLKIAKEVMRDGDAVE